MYSTRSNDKEAIFGVGFLTVTLQVPYSKTLRGQHIQGAT